MCRKSLIILLLGCALASANPIQGNGNLTPQQGSNVDIGSWLYDAHYGIRSRFKHTVKPFVQLYNALVKASNSPEYSKESIEELRFIFHEIIDTSRENLSDIENAIFTNTITHLQGAAEFLSTRPNQNIQTGQHVPHEENQKLQKYVNNQANKISHTVWSGLNGVGQSANNMGQNVLEMVNSQIENVKDGGLNTKEEGHEKEKQATIDEDAGFFSNLGNKMQRAVGGGVEDVKKKFEDWGNKWSAGMKTGQDFFHAFRDKVPKIFNNGKNTISSGVKNVQGNLNEWGNKGYELAQGFNNIGSQAQDTFGNGFNGMQNQFNHYVPGNNNLGGGYQGAGNLFDSRQYNVGKQLAQAIALEMSEIEKILYEWKNLVENFLFDGNKNAHKQPQELHEGMNGLGSIGYMQNIDKGLEISKNPIEEIFGNWGKKGGIVSGVNQFTGGYTPNKPKEDQKDSDDGVFTKIGKKVGGKMGRGVDKFTDAVEGFINHAGKLFGL